MNFIEILKSRPTYPGYPKPDQRTEMGKIRYQNWVAHGRAAGIATDLYDHPSYLKGVQLGSALYDNAVGYRNFWDLDFAPSFTGEYPRDYIGRPVHPYAEEIFAAGLAIEGPGAYWNYGPNLCADPIVLGQSLEDQLLKTIVIRRKDTGSLALPGGHCDYAEKPLITAARELEEETGIKLIVKHVYRAECVFEGIVPDPRTTINAWPETSVIAFILYPGVIDSYAPTGQDDAAEAHIRTVDEELLQQLSPAHAQYVRPAVKLYEEEFDAYIASDGRPHMNF